MSSAAPIVIAESATLNAGKCQPAAWKSRKSTTWPKRSRSMTLPSAPPRISASAARSRSFSGLRTIRTLTMPAATSAKPTSSGVCQPASRARKLNAAPLLNTRTRLKNDVTSSPSPGAKRARTIHFTSWSAAMTAAARPNHGSGLRMLARLAGAVQVAHAAGAEPVAVHVAAIVPAALALGMRAGRDLHLEFAPALQLDRGGQHHVPQLVADAGERFVVAGGRVQVYLRLERRAHLAGGAQVLDLLPYGNAQLAQPGPFREQGFAVGGNRQLIHRLEEHAVFAIAGKDLPELLGGEGQDRRHQPHKAVRDVEKRGLRGATRPRIGAAGIEPVLENVEVEAAQVLRAEILQLLYHKVELVTRVVRGDFLMQAVRSEEWNQPRCWSEPSRYMSAGKLDSSRCEPRSTVKCVVPESNQTSSVSRAFS